MSTKAYYTRIYIRNTNGHLGSYVRKTSLALIDITTMKRLGNQVIGWVYDHEAEKESGFRSETVDSTRVALEGI